MISRCCRFFSRMRIVWFLLFLVITCNVLRRFYDVNCQKIRPYQTDAAYDRAHPPPCTLILHARAMNAKKLCNYYFSSFVSVSNGKCVLRKNMKWHCHAKPNRTDKNQIAQMLRTDACSHLVRQGWARVWNRMREYQDEQCKWKKREEKKIWQKFSNVTVLSALNCVVVVVVARLCIRFRGLSKCRRALAALSFNMPIYCFVLRALPSLPI